MRPRIDWINQTDERILELLAESELVLTPTVLGENLGYDRSWVSERLKKLRDHGLVVRIARGKYRISERGEAYLSGDLDANELQQTEE